VGTSLRHSVDIVKNYLEKCTDRWNTTHMETEIKRQKTHNNNTPIRTQ